MLLFIIIEPCQVEICIVQRLTMDSDEKEADCLSRALSVNTATSSATIAAMDILHSEALPLSKSIKLTLLPKPDNWYVILLLDNKINTSSVNSLYQSTQTSSPVTVWEWKSVW